jgi:hypothetical protein
MGSQIWTEVHEEVQRGLVGLDELVRLGASHVQVGAGRTKGRSFRLFTYLTFSRTDATDIDPVVVGVLFTEAGTDEEKHVVIEADISGERTGDRIMALAPRTVPATREELLRAAHRLAYELSCHGQRIAAALRDPSRRA